MNAGKPQFYGIFRQYPPLKTNEKTAIISLIIGDKPQNKKHTFFSQKECIKGLREQLTKQIVH